MVNATKIDVSEVDRGTARIDPPLYTLLGTTVGVKRGSGTV